MAGSLRTLILLSLANKHPGYFIHTAAIIAYLDPKWLTLNAHWVTTLIRDTASPSTSDQLFPFSRMFDWYHGHSFAKGLFESADSKDEESSSEDAFFAYALKMWGKATGDQSMEARGNLMLGILARTLDNYFLMRNNNQNQPPNFIANKATGIVSIDGRAEGSMKLTGLALRKQDRSHNLLRCESRVYPRCTHASALPSVFFHALADLHL